MNFNLNQVVFEAAGTSTQKPKKRIAPLQIRRPARPSISLPNISWIGGVLLLLEVVGIIIFWDSLFELIMLVCSAFTNIAVTVLVIACLVFLLKGVLRKIFR